MMNDDITTPLTFAAAAALLTHRLVDLLYTRIHNGEFSASQLARAARVSPGYLNNCLRGRRKLAAKPADRIMRMLSLSAEDLQDAPPVQRKLGKIRAKKRGKTGCNWRFSSETSDELRTLLSACQQWEERDAAMLALRRELLAKLAPARLD